MTIDPNAENRVTLGTWPTPVEPAPRLAAAIGLRPGDLRVKRDDLTGLGAGGNKIRKLEWTIGAALAEGADTLQLAARTEGLVLDPVYTARALAGLAAAVRDGQVAAGQQTVFVHTGGLPGLFGHAAALEQAQHGLEQFPLDMERRHGNA